jgi:hypothetical protein
VAGELGPIAAGPLPEIPAGLDGTPTQAARVTAAAPASPAAPRTAAGPSADADAPATGREPQTGAPARVLSGGERRSSRRGGAILLGLGGVIVIAVIVIVIVLASGGSGGKHNTTGTSLANSTTPATGSTSTTPTAPGNAGSKALAVTILGASSAGAKSKGAAEIISEKGQLWLFLVAVNLAPSTTHPQNYYGVWLTNGPTDSQLIGFQTVPSSGRLAAFTRLTSAKSTYSRFKRMLVTLEPTANPVPKTPGKVVLSGPFNLK